MINSTIIYIFLQYSLTFIMSGSKLASVSLFFIRSFSSLIVSSYSLTRLRFDEIFLVSSLCQNLLIYGSFTIFFYHNLNCKNFGIILFCLQTVKKLTSSEVFSYYFIRCLKCRQSMITS